MLSERLRTLLVRDGIFLIRALREASEEAIADIGDVFVLDVGPANKSFVRPVQQFNYRHGDTRVMESSARDREEGIDLTRYVLARATLLSGES